ncbi:glycosyltransferase [Burkholderiaceae bacterium FT117]|uniref:glycosyltransferase n=1 Tax=Zeimonas sediminis TaxID=2944268 RepID=UPI002342CFD6|nr:glycosyltransferase [Zeimonas sediminis]MCM5571720.1 glycosyltransferase [Zeimonas sediminis]
MAAGQLDAETAPRQGARLRVLFAPAEAHPTYRPDVSLLFGRFLPAQGVDVDLVAVSPASASDAPWEGGAAHIRRFGGKLSFAWSDLLQQLSLLRLARMGYDALVVRDKPLLGLVGLVAAKLAGIPFVYWMSFPMAETYIVIARNDDGGESFVRRAYAWLRGHASSVALYRVMLPLAEYVFVQSPAMLEYVRARGLRHERVSAVPMGVDTSRMPDASKAGDIASRPGGRAAVYLGTLERLRRRELEAMVDAAREVAESVPDFTLLVIGEAESPDERGWLKAYAEAQGASHCTRFFGWLPHQEGLAIAATATLGLSPIPRDELFDMGSPTKAVEYLALGLPVVCNDQPDQDQVVRESGGGYSVPMTSGAFAGAILSVLRDQARAAEMGRQGRAWVARHRDYRWIAADVARALKGACGGRSFAEDPAAARDSQRVEGEGRRRD